MPNKRVRLTGKGKSDQFLAIPMKILNHDNFSKLSPYAVKLLLDIGSQYSGFNNGHMQATWSFMKKKGWVSRDTLNKAKKELLNCGLIMRTKVGGYRRPALYALTFKSIDDRDDVLDVKATNSAPGAWKSPDQYEDPYKNAYQFLQ